MKGLKEKYLTMPHQNKGVREMTKCPECDGEIKIVEDAMEGEIVTCPDCGASYELIKSGTVFDLRPAQSVGEDWGE
jgi:alpha-aminoadipate carrier protein LysW